MDNHVHWIDEPEGLRRMVDDLTRQNLLAVDTEANSLYAYHEQVCLIQISTEQTDYLIDPLPLPELGLLAPIFVNPAIEKIFHAAEYDLIGLKRDFGFTFANIFDTMQAGRILGRSGIGLGAMLEAEFGIVLDKRYQRANWGQRPLIPAQLDYARLDSHYLIPLRRRLRQALENAGRWSLAQEDFLRACEVTIPENGLGLDQCWRVSGSKELQPQQSAVLLELCRYRDQQAQRMDLPPFKVLGNHILLEVAVNCPRGRDELYRVPGMGRRLIERHGHGMLRAVERGLQSPPPQRPSNQRPDDSYLARLDALRFWRKETGKKMGVDSDVILPKDVMEQIADKNPDCLDQLSAVMHDTPWRLQQFGPQIITTLGKTFKKKGSAKRR